VSVAARFAEADTYIVSVVTWLLNLFLAAAGGGMGLLLLNMPWIWFWRERDYHADAFAAMLGQAQPLIDYLDKHQGFDVATPYYMSPQPYAELRIDELMRYLKTPPQPPTSARTQPLPEVS
jgi:Zn-dependent protease with chaperone function